ncbi:MAG: gliding motility-associated C-terminal domain-containing protein [bacterium]
MSLRNKTSFVHCSLFFVRYFLFTFHFSFFTLFLLPAPSFSLNLDFSAPTVCLGTPSTLISLCTPADSILITLWDLNADGKFDDAEGDTVVHLFATPGVLQVGIQVTTLLGVVKALYKDVGVASVIASFTTSNSCLGLPVSFHNTSEILADVAQSFRWRFGDSSPPDTMQNPVHTYTSIGIYTASLRVVTLTGCSDSTSATLQIVLPPELNILFSADTSLWEGTPLEAEATGQYDSLLWSTGSHTPLITITSPGNYSVTVWKTGCFLQISFILTIHTLEQPVIMNLFTPNGDGHNDTWIIRGYNLFGTCHVAVYDQWGTQVYANLDYQNTWDGSSDHGALPTGSYYYVVYYDNGTIYKGTIAILR